MTKYSDGLALVQADGLNYTARAETELARQVANNLHWQIHRYFGTIHDSHGEHLANNIEELARAGRLLGWFNPHGPGLVWGNINKRDPAAAAQRVRNILTPPHEESTDDTP